MKTGSFIGSLLAALLLAGCAAPADAPSPSPPSPSRSSTPTAAPTPTPTATSTPTVPPAAAAPGDFTAAMVAVAGPHVVKATQTEPGRVEVTTDLVDPRGGSGSTEANTAIGICQAVQQATSAEHVVVTEADGSSWILYGHPLVPAGTCGEV